MPLWLDLETYSTIDLKKTGSYVYAQDCELLLFGYAIGDGPVQVWDVYSDPSMPDDLHGALSDSSMKLVAHNVGFEWPVLQACLPGYDWSIERWMDSQVMSATNGLPLDLHTSTHEVNGETTKMSEGKNLVNVFCKPAPSNHKADRYGPENKPEEWQDFIRYCRDDVASMREMCQSLDQRNFHLEQENWRLNMRMNAGGLPMDMATSEMMIEQVAGASQHVEGMLTSLTGGAVRTPNQVVQLREWLNGEGFDVPDVAAATLEKLLQRDDLPDYVRKVTQLRLRGGKSSTAKYEAILRATADDGCIHGAFQFYGAFRTGREAGRLFQPQNLPRPEFKHHEIEEIIDLLHGGSQVAPDFAHAIASSSLRAMIAAGPDELLNVADLSNIEGRMLAWLGGEDWKLDAFREYDNGTGPDLYKMAYGRSFDKDPEDVTGDERQIGKVMELALGYAGGVGAFVQFAGNFNIDLQTLVEPTMTKATEYQITKATDMWVWAVEEGRTGGLPRDVYLACDILKQAWRSAHPGVVQLWYTAQDAVVAAMLDPETWYAAGRCTVGYFPGRKQLLIRLPSGRDIVYWRPAYDQDTREITYMGTHTLTRKWTRLQTYSGKLVENITQATARDVLFHGAQLAVKHGFNLRGTVHDELITLETSDRHKELEAAMSIVPEWAEGLPLSAEGYASKRYKK